MRARRYLSFRRRVHEVLDIAIPVDGSSRLVHRLLVALIIVSVAAVVLESVPRLAARYEAAFIAIEVFAAVIFTIEYIARLWASVENPEFLRRGHLRARLSYVVSPGAIIDLLAIVPFFLALIVPADLRVLMIFRLARFFKLARYSPGMRSLFDAFYQERRALVACLVIIGGLMLITASIMHLIESEAQPDKFGSIPDAMWWSISTLTTVGYGDAVPITPLGKAVAGITALLGLVMLALPVGIIATSFSDVIHKRDFVVTWGMVARVPLFSGLEANDVAEIVRYLRSQVAVPNEIITRRGEAARSMYFIASGEVEVEVGERKYRLGDGQFFGEIALIRKSRRSATARATLSTRLLVLDANDFHMLMEQHKEIGIRIREVVEQRLGESAIEPGGDIVDSELGNEETEHD